MKSYQFFKYITICCCCVMLLQSCRKTEFMPDPVGEAVPPSVYPALLEALNAPEYSLFKTAWERVGMNKILGTERPQGKFTFLVPNNQAMEAAGYTTATIGSANLKALEDLLRYHVLNDQVTLERLAGTPSDLLISTMLTHPTFLEGVKVEAAAQITVPYRYQHALMVTGADLWDNGIVVKTGKEIPVSSGQVITVNKVLEIPRRQMIDVLKEDGRFSLFLKSMELNDVEYANELMMNFSSGFFPPYSLMVDWNYFFEGTFHSNEIKRHVIRFTLFAPTDDAFYELGIHNEADLRALNNRIPTPVFYDTDQSTPLDSLLRLQRLGTARSETDIDWDLFIPSTVLQKDQIANNAVFYQHSLNNALLDGYIIRSAAAGGGPNYYVNYSFGRDASNRVTLKEKGSNAAPVTIITPDINTIQGPVHVVNRIMVPKGFRMWHKH